MDAGTDTSARSETGLLFPIRLYPKKARRLNRTPQ